ncbi:unnamed protein product [Rhodiola kirilowii]
MASLTPGVLSKLLKHAGDKNFKAVGEHRTPLLQVIEIVPALSPDDPWRTKGFYLKLSDSEHSAYASISDEDVDLIYGDKIQLGQFVHISRLDSGKPVPVIRGIKPLPRRRPCVGNPKDLISSDFLQPRTTRKKKGLGEASPSPRRLVLDDLKRRKDSFVSGNKRVMDDDLKPKCLGSGRRLSLDSARRGWDHHQCPTPRSANTARSSISHLKSTISDTPVTPRRASVVASSEKKHVTPCIPPLSKSLVGSEKKQSRPVISLTKYNASDILRLQSKEKALINDSKASIDATVSGRIAKVSLSSMSDKKISWDSLPTKIQELGKGVVSHRDVTILTAARALEEASAMERIVGCMSMFADLCESSENCSVGSVLETFLELHLSLERIASAIDKMLEYHVSNFNSISGVSRHLSPELSETFASNNAKAWIQAAVATEVSRFCLYSKQDKKGTSNGEKGCHVVLEKTTKESLECHPFPNTRITSSQVSHLFNGTTKVQGVAHTLNKHLSAPRKVKSDREQWSSQSGLKDAASLAQKLIWVSRQWFLKYLETSLKKGFGIQGKEKSFQILFGNLKKVNQWLEELVGNKHEIDERIEAVRKKLYSFLLENVDFAAHASK